MKAPFPWFGGKSRIAPRLWEAFGADVSNYVEPFAGSLGCLLARPWPLADRVTETINDRDAYVANFWRANTLDPESVAAHADWPVNEADLHARHLWLLGQHADLSSRLMGDPAFYDPKIAGWWVWGVSAWIGSGFCSGKGPWVVEDGRMVLGNRGQGVNAKRPHLGDRGQGVNAKRPHLGNRGQGVNAWFCALADRLRDVRVCCGDWSRIMGRSVTRVGSPCAVLLDPPYADTASRTADLYAVDDLSVAHDVRRWAIEHGDDPNFRIALCGYEGEHQMPSSWRVVEWSTCATYGQTGDGLRQERVWLSPHCLGGRQVSLFAAAAPQAEVSR